MRSDLLSEQPHVCIATYPVCVVASHPTHLATTRMGCTLIGYVCNTHDTQTHATHPYVPIYNTWDTPICVHIVHVRPLTEEIMISFNLKYLDLQITTEILLDLLSAGDSIYSREILEILGIPMISCLICTGTPMKTC